MTSHRTGSVPPNERKARAGTLTVREPHVESLVAGLNLDGINLSDLRQFCKALTVERSRWDVERRRIGLFSGRRITKRDADLALAKALAALKGGAE